MGVYSKLTNSNFFDFMESLAATLSPSMAFAIDHAIPKPQL